MLKLTIATSGIETFGRTSRIIRKTCSIVRPFASDFVNAAWITGPSAIGSENGIPISTRFAPAFSIAGSSAAVVARSGYPAGMNGISANCRFSRSAANVESIFPMQSAMIRPGQGGSSNAQSEAWSLQ